jgi:8-oxo-dGTP pyrophosphatase MutT (NUDIX family)
MDFFKDEILTMYRESLEEAGYDLSKKEITELIFNQIFPISKRR